LIITTSAFTADARREATRDGAPAIDLVDGETMCQLLKDLKLGIRVRLVEEVDVDIILVFFVRFDRFADWLQGRTIGAMYRTATAR
jgi:restriction system protein